MLRHIQVEREREREREDRQKKVTFVFIKCTKENKDSLYIDNEKKQSYK